MTSGKLLRELCEIKPETLRRIVSVSNATLEGKQKEAIVRGRKGKEIKTPKKSATGKGRCEQV